MLSFLFLRYLSFNYEESAKKELGKDYPEVKSKDLRPDFVIPPPLEEWYKNNEAWWKNIKSGTYQEYYEKQYGKN